MYIMSDESIYNIWSNFINDPAYSKFFKYNNWDTNFEELIKYIDTYKKRPNKRDNNEIIAKLGNWLLCQNLNYKKKNYSMKTEAMRLKWHKFITSAQYKQYFIK